MSKSTIRFILIILFLNFITFIIFGISLLLGKSAFSKRSSQFDSLNNEVLVALNTKDPEKLKSLMSEKYQSRIKTEELAKIFAQTYGKTCFDMYVYSKTDSTRVDEVYQGERLYYEYYSDLKCGEQDKVMKIFLNDKNQIIFLEMNNEPKSPFWPF